MVRKVQRINSRLLLFLSIIWDFLSPFPAMRFVNSYGKPYFLKRFEFFFVHQKTCWYKRWLQSLGLVFCQLKKVMSHTILEHPIWNNLKLRLLPPPLPPKIFHNNSQPPTKMDKLCNKKYTFTLPIKSSTRGKICKYSCNHRLGFYFDQKLTSIQVVVIGDQCDPQNQRGRISLNHKDFITFLRHIY